MREVLDDEQCYRAVLSKDSRFDGWFFTAVKTTGIYCRPSCPVVPPKRVNVRFFLTAAAAQQAGFRACKRCRPDATPGSPEWNARADLVGRAMRLIADGVVDRDGVRGLAQALGYSQRQVHRQLVAEVGAGPLALARAQRAQAARQLLEATELPVSQVAFAAGFSSIRQFNDTIRHVFARTPTGLRDAYRRRTSATSPGAISLRLPFRPPLRAAELFGFLAARAVPGVEEGSSTGYARTLSLPHGTGIVRLSCDDHSQGWVTCVLQLDDLRDLAAAVQRSRRLLDLDADPHAVAAVLGSRPGLRVPGAVDGDELAVRAVFGQQVSVAGARTLAASVAARYGRPLPAPDGSLTRLFPDAAALAEANPADLPMPGARRAAVLALARALAGGDVRLDPGVDRDEVSGRLLRLPGIGPWTVDYVRMRALGDPDIFLARDLGVRRSLERLGLPSTPGEAAALAERWRPWRSYAVFHLWSAAGTGEGEVRTTAA